MAGNLLLRAKPMVMDESFTIPSRFIFWTLLSKCRDSEIADSARKELGLRILPDS